MRHGRWPSSAEDCAFESHPGSGQEWREYSLSYEHNRLERNVARHFPANINHTTHWPRHCTAYTSLIKTGAASAMVIYNLFISPNFSGAFSMPIRVVTG